MQNFFNYTTLFTKLEKSTRTLFVTLNRPDWDNAFKLEMLFELESLFAWCLSKVEIHSICIQSSTSFFSHGLDLENLKHHQGPLLEKINSKVQKIILLMMQLPQTIVIDVNEGCQTLASEFCLGADLRICSEKASISFNHHHYGLIPAAGGMSLLNGLVSSVFAKSWVLSGKVIPLHELRSSGLISETYEEKNRDEVLQKILNSIAQSASVPRIQSKLAFYEHIKEKIEKNLLKDKKISKASMISEDWKSWRSKKATEKQQDSFMPAKSMSYAVKLSLIKNDSLRDH